MDWGEGQADLASVLPCAWLPGSLFSWCQDTTLCWPARCTARVSDKLTTLQKLHVAPAPGVLAALPVQLQQVRGGAPLGCC